MLQVSEKQETRVHFYTAYSGLLAGGTQDQILKGKSNDVLLTSYNKGPKDVKLLFS